MSNGLQKINILYVQVNNIMRNATIVIAISQEIQKRFGINGIQAKFVQSMPCLLNDDQHTVTLHMDNKKASHG